MQEGRQKSSSVVDQTPGKIIRGLSKMRATPIKRKNAARAPRFKTPCRERYLRWGESGEEHEMHANQDQKYQQYLNSEDIL